MTHAPLPWRIETARTASNNGSAHLYLVDANGRKIAAIWGPWDEKIETAQLILDRVNAAIEQPCVYETRNRVREYLTGPPPGGVGRGFGPDTWCRKHGWDCPNVGRKP